MKLHTAPSVLVLALTPVLSIACGGATSTVDLGTPAPPASSPGEAPAAAVSSVSEAKPVTPEEVLAGQALPARIAVGRGHVFFTSSQLGIRRYDVETKSLVELGVASPTVIAADENDVYFAHEEASIVGANLPGCSLQECDGFVPEFSVAATNVVAIALDATHVYWVEQTEPFRSTLLRASRNAAKLPGQSAPQAAREPLKSWSDQRVSHLVVDQTTVFAGGRRELLTIDKATKSFDVIMEDGPRGRFAVDESNVYWVDEGGVKRATRTGRKPETLAALGATFTQVTMGAFGSRAIYVLFRSHDDPKGGKVIRFDRETATLSDVATGLTVPSDGVLSGGYFYFTDTNAGTIARIKDL